MRSPCALLLCCLLALACGTPSPQPDGGAGGGDGGGAGGAGGGAGGGSTFADGGARDAGVKDAGFGPVAINSWCASKAWAICDRLRRCGAVGSTTAHDNCTIDELRKCDQWSYSKAVGDGRLQYDAQKAADCLNGYGTGGCALEPGACQAVFTGLTPPDSGCYLAEECAAGSFCYETSFSCPFTCRAFVPQWSLCNFGDKRCDNSSSWCGFDGGQYQCMPRKALGEACTWQNYDECPVGSSCATLSGDDEGVCTPTYAAVGQQCRVTGSYPICDNESFCRQEGDPQGPLPPGICARRVGVGGTCTGYGVCQPGLRCSTSFTTGSCIPLGKEGEICNGYGDCELGLHCESKTSRCSRYPGDGGDCSSTFQCDRGYYCNYTTDLCLPKRADGERCSDAFSSCLSGECAYGPLADGGSDYRCAQPCSVPRDGGL